MILKENLGFFFSCYKERDAVEFCIKNIRYYYPENPIYISSDGGYDFSDLCDKESKFSLYDDVLGYVNNPESKDADKLIGCCREFLNRIMEAAIYCNTEYIIYYEPDILLRGQISIPDDLEINGSFANSIHTKTLNLIGKYNPNNLNLNFGACGGSIIRVKSLLEVIQNTTDSILEDLINTDKRISNCDYLLTVLFSLFNYKYSENIDFVEAKRYPNWESSTHSIVHQYHKNYIKNYNGKYENS
jgi:hypothetical protein